MIRANFIGVDKHLDPDIRDLTGAGRDAKALWALFTDTVPDIRANLILNEAATTEALRHAINSSLNEAGPEDTVIISFAGHGTRDHRIVTFNTAICNLSDSTISMKEIADCFRNSKAQQILFVLDCCFSGGAPARVLESSPVPRDISNPFDAFKGDGRVLIAASNFDEVAYETPGSGHGLLTKALIEVLQSGDVQIEIMSAMSETMNKVRIAAERMGVTQTPVLVSGVTGGFNIPVLKIGKNYYDLFPEAKGVKISSDIKELTKFGIPGEIIDTWSSLFKNGFNDLQLQAINEYRVLDGESLLVVAPTSSGKTFIGEMTAARFITQGKKIIFLFPYRALTSEKYDQFIINYSEKLGIRVIRCTGDYVDQTKPFIKGKYDIALLTYEMFLYLSVSNPGVLNQIGLVVIDEAQFIADPNRGIVVELLLTFLLTARERGINPQLVALSAVIGGINDFDAWLRCKKLVTDKRPVPLTEGVLDRNGTFQYLNAEGETKVVQLLPYGTIQQRKNKPSSQDVIVPLVKKIVKESEKEKVIVFRNRKGPAEGAANYLAKELGLPAANEVLELLPNHDLSTTSGDLRSCLEGGTAFHNTNLSREERAIVEQSYRAPNSKVRVLSATTTVAAGINTPASTVIIAENKFMGEDGREFTVAEYKNMAGRAGRVGYQEEGKAIILAETGFEREQLFTKYVKGNLEIINSSFNPDHVETWIIRLLAQIDRIKQDEVTQLLANTYGGYLAIRSNPKWKIETLLYINDLLERMISLDLVEKEGDYVQLTLLGRACGRSALSFESTLRLVELLKLNQTSNFSIEKLMALIQALPELDNNIYTPVMKRGQKESIRQKEAAQRYGPDIIRFLQRNAQNEFSYYARCKRAAILWDWINGVSIETIEQQFTTTPYEGRIGYGEIRTFADATRFHLRSAYQIANIMFLGEGMDEGLIETMLKQLEVGIPADALNLLAIELLLERGEYLQLYQRGIKTEDGFWALTPDFLKTILSPLKIEKFKSQKAARTQ
ncbi:MAG: caspase family protein [Nitrospirae bacterium]|nr:caspase family protein [Nitrospirota bacterium]